MEPFTWMLIGLNLVMATVYLMLGITVAARRPPGPGRLAASAFSLWWIGLGVVTAGSMTSLVVSTTVGWSLPAYLAFFHVLLLVIVVALAGLVYYMAYLFTGRRGAWMPIAIAYSAYYACIVYYVAAAQPIGLASTRLGMQLEYANDLQTHWSTTALGLLLIVPPLVGALAYFSLFFRVRDRSQKFRIAAIAGAFIFWFGTSLAVSRLTDWGGTDAWRIGSTLVALAASWLVYVAFHPPNWVQRRFGLQGYGHAGARQ